MLEVRDVSFGFERGLPLYTDVSFEVAPGERLALQAPSGFGKTTLCRIMAGYYEPWTGEILVDGAPLPNKGVCPVQLILQHPETAVDPRLRMRSTLEEAGDVERTSATLVKRFDIQTKWLTRYPHELSGGELQRFCIVRALMAQPKYLIADEISTMLDPITQNQIWRGLVETARERDMGIVFVSHSPLLTERIATRVIDLTQYAC